MNNCQRYDVDTGNQHVDSSSDLKTLMELEVSREFFGEFDEVLLSY